MIGSASAKKRSKTKTKYGADIGSDVTRRFRALLAATFSSEVIGAAFGTEIQLLHDHSRKITEKVISFDVDYGIVVNPVSHPDLVIRLITTDEVSYWTGRLREKTSQ